MIWIGYAGNELLRRRILPVTLALTALFLGLIGFVLHRVAGAGDTEDMSLFFQAGTAMVLGLYFAQLLSAFFVLFSTMGTISGEIESGLMLAMLARPIPRWKMYLGKWLGFAFWCLLYHALLFWSIVILVRVFLNAPLLPDAVWKGFGLFECLPLLLLALSLLGSTALPAIGNGVACAMLLGLSMFSGLLENVFDSSKAHAGISNFAFYVSLLMPSDAIFRRMIYELLGGSALPLTPETDKMMGPFSSMGPFSLSNLPSAAFVVYAAVYLVALVAWGCARFQRKDIA
nr:ABC transporter permease [Cohnella sp. CFH 77786]